MSTTKSTVHRPGENVVEPLVPEPWTAEHAADVMSCLDLAEPPIQLGHPQLVNWQAGEYHEFTYAGITRDGKVVIADGHAEVVDGQLVRSVHFVHLDSWQVLVKLGGLADKVK